jgi:hypothetical protein
MYLCLCGAGALGQDAAPSDRTVFPGGVSR